MVRNVVCVTGGRDYSNHILVWKALDGLHEARPISLLVNGACRGPDQMSSEWARANKVALREFPPDWKGLGYSAGPRRNRKMLDESKPDVMLAFPGGRGTQDCLNLAHKRVIPIIRIRKGRPRKEDQIELERADGEIVIGPEQLAAPKEKFTVMRQALMHGWMNKK